MKKFATNIDLEQNEIKSARFENLASNPLNPVTGQIYYNTINKSNLVWDGSTWIKIVGAQELTISQGNLVKNVITVPTLTGNVNNWSPIGFDDSVDLIRVDVNANNRQITGLEAPSPGINKVVGIKNISTSGNDIRFAHNSNNSIAANRFLCRDNTRKSIKPNEIALWFYDHIVQRYTPFNRIG